MDFFLICVDVHTSTSVAWWMNDDDDNDNTTMCHWLSNVLDNVLFPVFFIYSRNSRSRLHLQHLLRWEMCIISAAAEPYNFEHEHSQTQYETRVHHCFVYHHTSIMWTAHVFERGAGIVLPLADVSVRDRVAYGNKPSTLCTLLGRYESIHICVHGTKNVSRKSKLEHELISE